MTDKPVRVLRLMEYIYPDLESATTDMAHWQVQGVYRPRADVMIRSTTLPLEVWEPVEKNSECICDTSIVDGHLASCPLAEDEDMDR